MSAPAMCMLAAFSSPTPLFHDLLGLRLHKDYIILALKPRFHHPGDDNNFYLFELAVAQFGAGEFATGAGPVAGLASMTDDADAAKAAINAMPYNGSGGTNMDGGIAGMPVHFNPELVACIMQPSDSVHIPVASWLLESRCSWTQIWFGRCRICPCTEIQVAKPAKTVHVMPYMPSESQMLCADVPTVMLQHATAMRMVWRPAS